LEYLLNGLPVFEQRNFVLGSLRVISNEYLSATVTSENDSRWWHADASLVSAAAELITLILANEESRKIQLVVWLTGSSGAGIGDGIAVRRAAIAAIAEGKADIETVLDKSLHQFGDQLYIRHTPTLQQEGTTLNILSHL
jgi:telomere length regulation protein